jgi:hypothetical protein
MSNKILPTISVGDKTWFVDVQLEEFREVGSPDNTQAFATLTEDQIEEVNLAIDSLVSELQSVQDGLWQVSIQRESDEAKATPNKWGLV